MSNLTQEMQDLITKNLPEATAGEMRKYLDEAERTKAQLIAKISAHERLQADYDKQAERLKAEDYLATRSAELDAKEKELKAQTDELFKQTCRNEAAVLTARLEATHRAFDTVFKVPAVRTEVQKQVVLPVAVNPQGQPFYPITQAATEVTTVQEE